MRRLIEKIILISLVTCFAYVAISMLIEGVEYPYYRHFSFSSLPNILQPPVVLLLGVALSILYGLLRKKYLLVTVFIVLILGYLLFGFMLSHQGGRQGRLRSAPDIQENAGENREVITPAINSQVK